MDDLNNNVWTRMLGVAPAADLGSKWGNRLGASIDSYQAGMWGLGEAALGAAGLEGGEDFFRQQREGNEELAQLQRYRAQRQGAVMSYKDAEGVGDYADWLGGMAVDSLPYLAESLAGGFVGRGLLTGGKTALGLSRGTAGTVGGVAASYPSAVGDILQNQREENGTTDLGSAALGGVPYAALNAVGLDGALASGKMTRAGIGYLDDMTGLKGAMARTAATVAKTAPVEGFAETGQELINQSFGRMAVNPDQTLFNPEANERYLDSFIGGAALGGTMGGALGGWRRSEGYQPQYNLDDPAKPADLLGAGPKLDATAPGEQGALFGDLGIDGLMSELPAGRTPGDAAQELVQKYDALASQVRQLDAGMADAEGAGNAQLFYTLKNLRDEVAAQIETLERQFSAIQAEQVQPGQMGLFGSGEAPIRGIELEQIPNRPDVQLYQDGTPRLPAPQSPAMLVTPEGGVATSPRQLSGQQFNLFDGLPTTFGEGTATPAPEAPQRPVDTRTRDMLVEKPTAMVQTMFNPATEPNTTGTRGAVAGNIRSQLVQQLGASADPAMATKLSLDIASNVGSLPAMTAAVEATQKQVEKALAQLDRKVTGGSDVLSPEEYAAQREKLDNKLATVYAAQELLQRYQGAATNAYAAEGAAKAQPGQSVGTAPEETGATEQAMRDNSMAAAVAEHDANVAAYEQDRRRDNAARERRAVLEQVLSSPNPRDWSAAKFSAALKAAGFTDTKATPQEQEEIVARTDRRNDVRAAAVVPPGPAAANGRLTPRASLDAEAPTQPAGQPQQSATGSAAPSPAQPVSVAASPGSAVKMWDIGRTQYAKRGDGVIFSREATRNGGATPWTVTRVDEAVLDSKPDHRYENPVATLPSLEEVDSTGEPREAKQYFREEAKRAWQPYASNPELGLPQFDALTPDAQAQWQTAVQKGAQKRSVAQAVAAMSAAAPSPAQHAPITEPARADIPAETGAVAPAAKPVPTVKASAAPVAPAKTAGVGDLLATAKSLMDAVDNVKGEQEYDGAVMALRKAYDEAQDTGVEDFIDNYVAASDPEFEREWRAAGVARAKAKKSQKTVPASRAPAPKVEPVKDAGVAELSSVLTNWVRFSQGTAQPAGKSVPVARVQQIAQQVLEKLGIADVVRIEAFGNPADAKLPVPTGLVPAGVLLNDGRIFLFADNIASEIDAFRVVFHELFHLGLSKTVGQNAYVQQMLKFKLDPLVNQYAQRWKQSQDGVNRKGTMPVNNYEALAVEEALADIAEDLASDKLGSKGMKPFVRSMVGKLAELAQFVGLDKAAQALRRMTYTQAEKFVVDTIKAANYAGETKLRGSRYSQAKVPTESDLAAAEKAEGVPKEFVEKWKKRPFGVLVRNTASGWRGNPWLLGALTLDQLKDRFPKFTRVADTVNSWLNMGNRANQMMRPVADLHKQWAGFTRNNKAHGQVLNKLFIEATLGGVWVDGAMEPRQDPRNKHLDFTDPQVVKAATTARSLYTSLPEAGQRLYRDITADLGRQFEARQRALLKRVVDAYKGDLKGVLTPAQMMDMADLGAKKRAALLDSNRAKWGAKDTARVHAFAQALDVAFVSRGEVPGPYFPLTRKGDHVVVFKTDKFKRAEQELKDARQALDDLLGQPVPEDGAQSEALTNSIVAARKRVTQAKGALETAKGSDNDYIVEFYEYRVQAQDRAQELGQGAQVKTRQLFMDRTDGVPAGFLNKLDAQVRKELGSQSAKDVADAVRQMVIRSLPERSAFKAELRRMKVAGANPEHAMWAYLSSSHRNAWTVSRLENITDMTTALNEARASENQDEVLVANELVKRYSTSLAYSESNALIDAAANLSYLTHLGLSVGYWVQNMVQPWTVSLPVMAGHYGYRASAKALADATGDAVRAVRATIRKNKTGTNWDMPMDLTAFKGHERDFLNQMLDAGKIDITVRADLTSGESTATNPLGHVVQQAANISSLPAHMVESVNRVATALAVYRLELEKGATVEAATAAAEKVVVQTHVDYSMENAPRFMNPNALGGLGRLAFQFRRYQQAMVFLWGKLLVDAVKHGDKDSAKALMYLTGSTFAVAGMSGLPLAAPLGLAAGAIGNSFSEDDEDKDRVEWLWAGVQSVVGESATNLLRKGAPAMMGVDVSQRIGMGGILSPIYNMPNASTGQEWMGAVASTLFGAAGGMLAGWADAAYLAQDNPAKAVEKFMPAGARAFMQAVDRETRGVTDRKGNVLVDEAELGGFDFAVKALNLGEVTDVSNMYAKRAAIKGAEVNRTDARNRLMREYTRARLDGDSADVARARAEVDAFNQRHPDANARIKFSNLQASYKEEQRRRRELQLGVRVTSRNRDIAEDFGVTAE